MNKRIFTFLIIAWVIIVILSLIYNLYTINKANSDIENNNKEIIQDISNSVFKDIIINKFWREIHEKSYLTDSDSTDTNDTLTENWKSFDSKYVNQWITNSTNSEGTIRFRVIGMDSNMYFPNADSWEKRAIYQLISGETTIFEKVGEKDELAFRFMAPISMEKNCYSCHGQAETAENGIKGGLSIKFSAGNYYREPNLTGIYLVHLILLIIGIYSIYILKKYSSKQEYETNQHIIEIEKQTKERQLAQISLFESEKRFKNLVENQSVLIFRMLPDLTISYSNPAFISFFHTENQLIEGKNFVRFLDNEDIFVIKNAIASLNITNKSVSIEHKVKDRNEEIRWLNSSYTAVYNSSNMIVEYMAVCQDITTLKELEANTRASENFIKESQSIAHLGNWVLDISMMRFKCSDEVFKILGLVPSQKLPSFEEFVSMVHPEDKAMYVRAIEDAIKMGVSYEFDYRFYLPDMTVRYAFAIGKPIIDNKGNVIKLSGTILDITERKLAEQELKIAKEKAEEATYAKSRFLATMSDEIKTPLNHIMGMTELINSPDLSDTQKENLEVINMSVNNLLNIFNDILDFSNIETGNLQIIFAEFNLRNQISMLLSLHKSQIQAKGLNFDVDINSNIPHYVVGDSKRFSQILNNILSNAIKFTKEGKISLKISIENENERNIKLLFRVKDTGIGISSSIKNKLFQEFTQEYSGRTREYGGTGLGLAISKNLVELHGGEIGMESEVGKGSEFWFTILFQRSNQIELNLNNETEAENDTRPKNYKILLAEDNLMSQKIVKGVISKMGYGIDIANNGLEAVDMYKSNDYDIILMDIQMPVMDGITATKEIRNYERENNFEKRIKIIAFTANFLKEDLDLYRETEMDDFISKPFKSKDLNQIIEKHL